MNTQIQKYKSLIEIDFHQYTANSDRRAINKVKLSRFQNHLLHRNSKYAVFNTI